MPRPQDCQPLVLAPFAILILIAVGFGATATLRTLIRQAAQQTAPVQLRLPSVSTSDPKATRNVDFTAILVAAYQSETRGANPYVFLSIDKQADPPPAVMSAFARVPSVAPFSDAVQYVDSVYRHRVDEREGIVVSIVALAWLDKDNVIADGHLYRANLSGESFEMHLRRVNGIWTVVSRDVGRMW